MKKNKILCGGLLLLAGTLLGGCYDLDRFPADQISQGTFWKNETHVKQGITAVYNTMKWDHVFGFIWGLDGISDIGYGYGTGAPSYYTAISGTYTAREDFVVGKWQQLYEGVQRANSFIANVQAMNNLDETVKLQYVSEARFMRALFYFELLNFFGGVPYYDETTNVNRDYANMKRTRSTEEEIRGHILDDLTAACANLPVSYDAADYGRATRGAAYALRGKVYLYAKEWKKAIADFEEIVYNKTADYGYELAPSYKDLFALYNGKTSKEYIFAVQSKVGAGIYYGNKLGFHLGTRSTFGGCWSNLMPSNKLMEMYEYPDGKPFSWEDIFPGYNTMTSQQRKELLWAKLSKDGKKIEVEPKAGRAKILNAYKNRDPRLMMSTIVPYSTYKGCVGTTPNGTHTYVLYNPAGGAPNEKNKFIRRNYENPNQLPACLWRKFVPEGNLNGAWLVREHCPFEFPLIRLADVLLMLSEAYNEDNQLDKAIVELNKVRQRKDVNMPPLNNGDPWMSVTTKAEMTERIRKERGIELACEGHRLKDLKRWGIAIDELSERPIKGIYGDTFYTQKFGQRDMLWPIPAVELERNEALRDQQNPGW